MDPMEKVAEFRRRQLKIKGKHDETFDYIQCIKCTRWFGHYRKEKEEKSEICPYCKPKTQGQHFKKPTPR